MKKKFTNFLFVAGIFFYVDALLAQDGSLDQSFGNGGYVINNFN